MIALSKQKAIFHVSTKTRVFPSNTIPFDTEEADEETISNHVFYMDKQVYDDMGEPQTITVTIEPGDTLND